MKYATMLFKIGTQYKFDCGDFDTIIVDRDEVESKLKEGWEKHPLDCIIDTVSAPTREELESKSKELNIVFDGRTSDKTLSLKIEEALNVVD